MQDRTIPTAIHTFAPRPGGHLLCFWASDDTDLGRIRAALLCLPKAPACGVMRQTDNDLVLIWVDSYLERALVEQTLAGLGNLMAWPAPIDCTSSWQRWYGEPYDLVATLTP